MADTSTQKKVGEWVRREWMPLQYGQQFSRDQVYLTSGGVFHFDAVSADRKIVAAISTSGSTTASGKHAVGKMNKIRSDMYFLLLTRAQHTLVLLTERDMYERWIKEQVEKRRVPSSIKFEHVEIPARLNRELRLSRQTASLEVTPE